MTPKTMQHISQLAILIGALIGALGVYGNYYYGKMVDNQNENSVNIEGNTGTVSVNQSGGQTAHTIINQKPLKRDLKEYQDYIINKLKEHPPLKYTIYIQSGDSEVRSLADQIQFILKSAKWDGQILTKLNGSMPDGITFYRDQKLDSNSIFLDEMIKSGLKIEEQSGREENDIGIYIGQNPNSYLGQ